MDGRETSFLPNWYHSIWYLPGLPGPDPGDFLSLKSHQKSPGTPRSPYVCPIGLYQVWDYSATEFRFVIQSIVWRSTKLRLPPASAQAPHPSSCRKRQASVAALRLLLPRQTLRWFASERPLRGRFRLTSDFRQCRGDSKGGQTSPFVSSWGWGS